MEDDIQDRKKSLRREIKARLSSLSAADREEKSRLVRACIEESPLWRKAERVLAFFSIPGEPDLRPLLKRALEEGKLVGLPRIAGRELVFHRVTELEAGLNRGAFGILEPRDELPVVGTAAAAAAGTMILVPGLAFDLRGGRLGRGGGYYDGFLRGVSAGENRPAARVIGVCFAVQLVERVPMGTEDIEVDAVVTENGILAGPSSVR